MDLLTSPGVKAGPIVGSGLTLPAARLAGNSTGATGMEAISLGAGLSLSGAVLAATVAGFDGTVTAYANLPVDGSAALNAIYLVRQSSGTWFINRTQRGLYQRIATTGTRATDWQYLGEWLEEFSDANFNIYNGSDNTKALAFSLSGITTGTTRTITFPDQSGTVVLQGSLTGSGLTMATARLLGRTTASTGAVEELTVGSSLSLSGGALDAIQDLRTSASPAFNGLNIGAGTGSYKGIIRGTNLCLSIQSTSVTPILQFVPSSGDIWRLVSGILTAGDFGMSNETRSVNPLLITGGSTTPTITLGGSSAYLTLAPSVVTIASGVGLQLGSTYSAGVTTATGTIAIKDSTGTTYNVLVHT